MTAADPILGDPKRFAQQQFDTALELCGACRDYHALWPYRRLAGMANGFEDAHILQAHLRECAPERGHMLIAGAADAGLLALAVQATESTALQIDVADRCATSLAICSAYAASHGFTVGTLQRDLPSADLPKRYDLIFAHCFLQFVESSHRVSFLRRLSAALTQTGVLVLAERLRPEGQDEPRHGQYVDLTVGRLAAAQIPLPEDEPLFRRRLASDIATRRQRLSSALDEADLPACLHEAGFKIRSCEQHRLQRRMTAGSGLPPAYLTIQIAVARREK